MLYYRQAILFVLCTVLCGCADRFPSGSLEGAVSVNGKPLPQGTLNFTPLESGKGPTVTAQISEGRYAIDAVPLGRNRVVIHAMQETGKMLHDKETGLDYAEMENLVPRRYQLEGVEIEVSEGKQSKDFELKS